MTETEVVEWIGNKAPLIELCEIGGWPDNSTLRVDICSQAEHEWIVNITFDEYILEISECNLSRYSRCGKYSVNFDAQGHPEEIRLLYPM